ncbi:MAG TPA: prepilin peptidase, partial [Candidatus Saccharimonadia bacterium]|nr:prepilin peptidase [Candidatus Saccharimonadia bacterium]
YLIYQISQGKWIGGGDVKLALGLGLLLGGPLKSILMVFLASLIGTLIVFGLLIAGKIKTNIKIPFGPLLITSTIFCFFFGSDIINWYSRLVG